MSTTINRIAAFDHVRGLAVIFMIICHSAIVFGSEAFGHTVYGWIAANVLGTGPAAPVFMLLMGLFFAYPIDKPFIFKVTRGLKLIALGLLLDLARGVLPYVIALQFHPSILDGFIGLDEKIGYADGLSTLWHLFYSLDILQFAGIAYIIMACLQLFLRNLWQWMSVCVIVILASPLLWGTGEDLGWFYKILLQPLWGSAYIPGLRGDNDFPAFPWLIYPIAGFILGELIKSGLDNHSLMIRMSRYGAGLILISSIWFYMGGTEQVADYYRMYPGGSLFTLGFALLWIAMFMKFTEQDWWQASLEKLNFWSRNITLVYCVQWVIIGFAAILFGIRDIDNLAFIILLTLLTTLATYLATVWLSASSKFMGFLNLFTK